MRIVIAVTLALLSCSKTAEPLVTAVEGANPAAPVLVVLHGYGADERNLLPLGDGRHEVIGYRAPLPLPNGGYAWFTSEQDLERSRDRVIGMLEGLRGREVTLVGFSQGAMVTIAVTVKRPELVQQAIAIGAGRVSNVVRSDAARPRLVVMHGTRDRRVPVSAALQNEAALKAVGANVELRQYDADHEISAQMRADLSALMK